MIARIALFLTPLALLSGCQGPPAAGIEEPALKAGAAELEITPPIGFRMAGYFDERLSTGVHDPLKAKALVIQQGREQAAFVFCDLVGLPLMVTTNARARARQRTGIPVSHIVIGATHTHTGPLFLDVRRYYFHQAAVAKYGQDPHEAVDYPALLIDHLAKVIAAAQANLAPVELSAGITKQEGLTFNRRFHMKNGKVAFNPGRRNPDIVRPAGPTDADVGILQARRPGAGQPFAGLTTFALHSDTVGGTEYSADYEYYLQETLRQAYGSDFISLFGAGTCGDLNHIDVTSDETLKGFSRAEHIGNTLGRAVRDAAPKLSRISAPALAVRSKTLPIELQDYTPEQLAHARSLIDKLGDPNTPFTTKVVAVKILDLAGRPPICPMEVQVFRLDADTAIVCLPCEIFVELGLAIKRASPFRQTMVISICNDRPSYVPTTKAFAEGSYEITNARVKPGTGDKLVETAVELLKNLKRPS